MHIQGWSCNHQHLGYSYTTIHEPRYVLSLPPNIDLGVHIDLVLGGCVNPSLVYPMKPGSKWMIFQHRGLGCPAFSVPCCAYFGDHLPSDMHLIEITPQLRFPWTTALHFFPSKDAFALIVSHVFQNMEVLHLYNGFWMFSACRKPSLGPGHKLMSTSLSSPSRFRKIQRCMAQD